MELSVDLKLYLLNGGYDFAKHLCKRFSGGELIIYGLSRGPVPEPLAEGQILHPENFFCNDEITRITPKESGVPYFCKFVSADLESWMFGSVGMYNADLRMALPRITKDGPLHICGGFNLML